MDRKKINKLIQKILYAVLTCMMIFKLTISFMQSSQMIPSLLPFKLAGAYVIILVVIEVSWYGFIKKKSCKLISVVSEKIRIINLKISDHAFEYMRLFLRLMIYNVLIYSFTKNSDVVQGMALVNIVKRTGISINNMDVMLAYYGDGLTGIGAAELLAYILPLLQLMVIIGFLYLIACQMDVLVCEEEGFVSAVLLSETVLTLIFIATASYDKIWICLLAAGLLYLFDCRDRYAGLLTGYCVIMWFASVFLGLDAVLILPIAPVIGFVLVKIYMSGCRTGKGYIHKLFCPLLCVLILVGTYINFGIMRNSDIEEMMPEEYKQILDYLPDIETTKILAPDDLLWYIRAKSKDIGMLYEVSCINSSLADRYYDAAVCAVHRDMREPEGKLGNIVQTMRGNGCNYLILPVKADERWAMEQNGYMVKYENRDYVLYEDMDFLQEEM